MAQRFATDVTVVLDRSGSMSNVVEETISGFNGFVISQRNEADSAAMTLIQFDDQYETVFSVLPIGQVRKLTTKTYVPRGSTALLDAIGRTVVETGARLATMPEVDRPERVVIVILTDGYENASTQYSITEIAEMIRHQESVYSWQFVFLGANQDAIATAAGMGVSAGAALSYAASADGVNEVFASVSSKISLLRQSGRKRTDHLFDEGDRRRNEEHIKKQKR